jgi:hypothetical protein
MPRRAEAPSRDLQDTYNDVTPAVVAHPDVLAQGYETLHRRRAALPASA